VVGRSSAPAWLLRAVVVALFSSLLGVMAGACVSGAPDDLGHPQQPALALQAGHCWTGDVVELEAPSRHCTARSVQVAGSPAMPQGGTPAACEHRSSLPGAGRAAICSAFGAAGAVTRSLAQLQVWRH
jgi:hypothetical protein